MEHVAMLTEEEQVRMALEQSATEERERADLPLVIGITRVNDGLLQPRCQLDGPLDHHFRARGGLVPIGGGIMCRGTLNQFHAAWGELISKHGTAASICGYITAATCELLCRAAHEARVDGVQDDDALMERLVSAACDWDSVQRGVDSAMAAIKDRRQAYIASNLASFGNSPNCRKARNYIKAWVANYELSDLMADAAAASPACAELSVFVRMNQFPELEKATHEEAERIRQEEARFGGRRLGGAINYADQDSVFFVQRFDPCRQVTPDEWEAEEIGQPVPRLRVCALDLSGHYTAAFALNHRTRGPMLVVLNSTHTAYADRPQVCWTFDLLFPPSMDEEGLYGPLFAGVPCQAGREGDVSESSLQDLLAMGFVEADARAALQACGGDIARAAEMLLGS